MSNPTLSPAAQAFANFQAWERRGRGWIVYPHPVALEPPFLPFTEHWAWTPTHLDNGRRPGLLSRFFGSRVPVPRTWQPEDEEPEPLGVSPREDLAELRVLLPPTFDPARDSGEQLLAATQYLTHPVSFELLGLPGRVSLQFACAPEDQPHLTEQLRSTAPESAVLRGEGMLAEAWDRAGGVGVVVDLGLANDFMRPLRSRRERKSEPLAPLIAALGGVAEGEVAVLQVLFTPARHPWGTSILRAVHGNDGAPFFATGPDLVRAAQEKVARPLFACRIRLAARARTHERTLQILRGLLAGFSQFSVPQENELIALETTGWSPEAQILDLLCRTTHRPGMLLNADELLGLVHLPGAGVTHERFERLIHRSRAAPEITAGHRLILGENRHLEAVRTVTLSPEQRRRHLYTIGASGTGKSTLLLNSILQDIDAGRGLAVLDPHGDLIDAVLARVPQARVEDVVVVDPADEEYPVGFNILSAHSELEKTLLSSDLVAIFRRLSTSWGDQMNSVFANAILAILESSTGGTLLDLRRFLVEADFRKRFLQTVADPEVVYYWTREYPLLRGNAAAPILTRLDAFLRPKLIRHMVGQRSDRLDFGRIMNEGRVLLVRLSHGAIGQENAYLLGSVLVSKLHQMALARQAVEESERADFFLYIDEFHHFVTPSLTELLSGVRKYRLGLVLAHQNMAQLGGATSDIAAGVLGNAATRVVFRVGEDDAKRLAGGFSNFEAADLLSLGVGEAIARVERADFDFNLQTLPVAEVDSEAAAARRREVIESSRARYATPRSELVLPVVEMAEEPPRPVVAEIPEVQPPAPEPPASPSKRRVVKLPAAALPATPGRGGAHHKYLQSLISRFGQDRGFRVELEKPVLDGAGYVDVALEKSNCRVACEISVTTDLTHELGNIQKCLAAGFEHVAFISADPKMRKAAGKELPALLGEGASRVRVLSPEEVVGFLDEVAAALDTPAEQTVAGYKVKVKVGVSDPAEQEIRKRNMGQVIGQALKRLRGKEK